MRISDFFFLSVNEAKRNKKMICLVFFQIVFIFLSASFLFIAQGVIEKAVYAYIDSYDTSSFFFNANYKMNEEIMKIDALKCEIGSASGSAYTKSGEEFQYYTYFYKDADGKMSEHFENGCMIDKTERVFFNETAAQKVELKAGDQVEILSNNREKATVTLTEEIHNDFEEPCIYIPYDYYTSLFTMDSYPTYILKFDSADQYMRAREQLKGMGIRIESEIEDYLKVFDMIRIVVVSLFVLIVVLGLNSFRNMCSIFMNARQDFFVRCKINGIRTKYLKIIYPWMIQIILLAGVGISIPSCSIFIKSSSEIAGMIVEAKVMKEFEWTDCLGVWVSFLVGSIILWAKWLLFGRRLNKGNLANMIDVKE